MKKITILIIFTLINIFSLTINAEDDFDSDDFTEEKCYCIAFAGQNDFKNPNKQNLPDKSTVDNDCDYGKIVPAGSCETIGGSLIPGQKSGKK